MRTASTTVSVMVVSALRRVPVHHVVTTKYAPQVGSARVLCQAAPFVTIATAIKFVETVCAQSQETVYVRLTASVIEYALMVYVVSHAPTDRAMLATPAVKMGFVYPVMETAFARQMLNALPTTVIDSLGNAPRLIPATLPLIA
jgi:hypothetical protein